MKETSLWRWLKPVRLHFQARLHMSRVENLVIKGMADAEGCLDSSQFWLELKVADRPVRADTPIHVRFEDKQPGWLRHRRNAGGLAWVLLQVGEGHKAKRYLLDGLMADELAGGLLETHIAAKCAVRDFPDRFDPSKAVDFIRRAAGKLTLDA